MRYIEDLFGICPEIYVVHHAESHCIGASYFYGQKDALVVSCDGYGDGVSTRIYNSDEQNFELVYESNADISLGDFYTAFTNYLGFKSIEGEYKVMGMAAYGNQASGQLQKYIDFDNSRGNL